MTDTTGVNVRMMIAAVMPLLITIMLGTSVGWAAAQEDGHAAAGHD